MRGFCAYVNLIPVLTPRYPHRRQITMAKNKNRKQGGPQQRGTQDQARRGAEELASAAEQTESAASAAQFAPGGGKRQKKFGHN